jgi:cupredoxin-like protein
MSLQTIGRWRYVASDYQLQVPPMWRATIMAVLLLGSTAAYAADASVSIAVRDHQFVPAEVAVPAGVRVELTIRNEQSVPAEFESTSLHREKVIPPGITGSIYVGPLQPGRYEFFDDFHPATRGNLVAK